MTGRLPSIARNHPFVDRNKRAAWVTARLFLRLNRAVLRFQAEDAVRVMLAVAAGRMEQSARATWFQDRIV